MEHKQQGQQQQQFDESNISPNISPRRRNPPLNLDEALYLQSQASQVQEPNERVVGEQQSSNQLEQARGSLSSSAGNNPQAAKRSQWNQLNYAKNHHNNFNISVDYIDCLSNDDLLLLSGQHLPGGLGMSLREPNKLDRMKVFQSKKHLRFHRNRVEPSLPTGSSVQDPRRELKRVCETDERDSSPLAAKPDGQSSLAKEQQAATASSSAGVLYPISVSDVKKRTYFIGQLSQDSLLGEEELQRYFPNARVSIFVCTWNQNRKRAPSNLNELLLPDQLIYMPDIYAIGIQEAFSSQQDYLKEWEVELQTTLGPNHVLLHSCSLGTLHLALFVRRDLIWFCSTPEESLYNSRSMPTNMIKTKGAISIAFRFFGTSFMFTNCHFPANENKLKERIDEYQRIINSIDLPKNLKLLKPRYLSNDSTARFDCVFFMGDLNFRLEQRTFDETIHILEDIFTQKEPSYEALTQYDELLKVMESNQAFHGFDEAQIKFPPTYKFLAKTNKYDKQTRRVPSYTDRILFRSKRQRHIQCLIYDWLPQLTSSDHKPVYCLFDVLVRPGHEQNGVVASLNAGLFQRAVYLEALKRRAEDPEGMRGENGQEGNSFICSIS